MIRPPSDLICPCVDETGLLLGIYSYIREFGDNFRNGTRPLVLSTNAFSYFIARVKDAKAHAVPPKFLASKQEKLEYEAWFTLSECFETVPKLRIIGNDKDRTLILDLRLFPSLVFLELIGCDVVYAHSVGHIKTLRCVNSAADLIPFSGVYHLVLEKCNDAHMISTIGSVGGQLGHLSITYWMSDHISDDDKMTFDLWQTLLIGPYHDQYGCDWANLTELHLAACYLKGVSPLLLTNLLSLTLLDLSSNFIAKWEPIAPPHTKLCSLMLGGNKLVSLAPIPSSFPALQHLDLAHNCIETLNSIEKFSKLESLDLRGNNIKSWEEVLDLDRNCPASLQKFWMDDNPIQIPVADVYRLVIVACVRSRPSLTELDGQEITRLERSRAPGALREVWETIRPFPEQHILDASRTRESAANASFSSSTPQQVRSLPVSGGIGVAAADSPASPVPPTPLTDTSIVRRKVQHGKLRKKHRRALSDITDEPTQDPSPSPSSAGASPCTLPSPPAFGSSSSLSGVPVVGINPVAAESTLFQQQIDCLKKQAGEEWLSVAQGLLPMSASQVSAPAAVFTAPASNESASTSSVGIHHRTHSAMSDASSAIGTFKASSSGESPPSSLRLQPQPFPSTSPCFPPEVSLPIFLILELLVLVLEEPLETTPPPPAIQTAASDTGGQLARTEVVEPASIEEKLDAFEPAGSSTPHAEESVAHSSPPLTFFLPRFYDCTTPTFRHFLDEACSSIPLPCDAVGIEALKTIPKDVWDVSAEDDCDRANCLEICFCQKSGLPDDSMLLGPQSSPHRSATIAASRSQTPPLSVNFAPYSNCHLIKISTQETKNTKFVYVSIREVIGLNCASPFRMVLMCTFEKQKADPEIPFIEIMNVREVEVVPDQKDEGERENDGIALMTRTQVENLASTFSMGQAPQIVSALVVSSRETSERLILLIRKQLQQCRFHVSSWPCSSIADGPSRVTFGTKSQLPIPLAFQVLVSSDQLKLDSGLNAQREGTLLLVPEHRIVSWCQAELSDIFSPRHSQAAVPTILCITYCNVMGCPDEVDEEATDVDPSAEWSALCVITSSNIIFLRDNNRNELFTASSSRQPSPSRVASHSDPFSHYTTYPISELRSIDIHPYQQAIRLSFASGEEYHIWTRDVGTTQRALRGLYSTFCSCRGNKDGSVAVLEIFSSTFPAVSHVQPPRALVKLPRNTNLNREDILGYYSLFKRTESKTNQPKSAAASVPPIMLDFYPCRDLPKGNEWSAVFLAVTKDALHFLKEEWEEGGYTCTWRWLFSEYLQNVRSIRFHGDIAPQTSLNPSSSHPPTHPLMFQIIGVYTTVLCATHRHTLDSLKSIACISALIR